MIGKSVFFLAFLVSIIAVYNAEPVPNWFAGARPANNSNKSHNLIVGSRLPGDRLVLKQSVIKSSSLWQVVKVQKTFNISKYERITQVRAMDQKTNGNGAEPSLLKGGPGYNNVTLQFKSKSGHGINFVVEIYARP